MPTGPIFDQGGAPRIALKGGLAVRLDTGAIEWWDSGSSSWVSVAAPGGALFAVGVVSPGAYPYVVGAADDGLVVLASAVAGAVGVRLPNATGGVVGVGFRVGVAKTDGSANAVGVLAWPGEFITPAATSVVILAQGSVRWFECISVTAGPGPHWLEVATGVVVGTSLGQVADGAHTHAGVYDPAGSAAAAEAAAEAYSDAALLAHVGAVDPHGDRAAAAAALAAHVAAADPHGDRAYAVATFVALSSLAAPSGVATLDAGSLVVQNPARAQAAAAASKIPIAGSNAQLDPAWIGSVGDKSFQAPPGLYPANLTAVTALTTGLCHAVYLGRAWKANPTFDVVQKLTTNAGTITWAEVAIATGTPAANAGTNLTKVGFTSVAATYNAGATASKKTTVTTAGVKAGDDVWLLYGSQATTPFQVRGVLADDIQSGVFLTASARPSTMGAGTAFALAGATVVPAWCTVRQY